ncbi:hypothetical protein PG990_006092 [Apiospora arundinis]|uniref:BTB domain-containing protein n=1 Tax=Apiospora arundinis TaxID=335852 RepID=A0ABR2J9G9_9PEZI
MAPLSSALKRASRASGFQLSTILTSENVQVIVGEEGREFTIARELLASCSHYFRDRLDATAVLKQQNAQFNILWLEDQDPEMFELFTYWLHQRHSSSNNNNNNINASKKQDFRAILDDAVRNDYAEELQWDLVNLHLFAAHVIEVPALQDAAMDAVQDLHLMCNWDISSKLVRHVYVDCDADASCRLRKWIVAMTAWTLGGGFERPGTAQQMQDLFEGCPDFWRDYVAHISKISKSRVRIATKNPQLRLPSNNLRNEERQFGFRQCSFHTHRSIVKQGRCPHVKEQLLLQHQKQMQQQHLRPAALALRSPVSDSDSSESEFDSTYGIRDELSPRSTIFDLYLGMP